MRCPSCQSENDHEALSCFTCGAALGSAVQIRKGSVVGGRYEILEPLGKGGMGMVYKAHDRELDETVALKLLRQDIAADPEMQKRFRAEVKLARKVRHRNVCGIHEFGADGNLRYIAMEYIEGVDMRHVLNRKGAPLPEEAFEIAIQVGQGLQAIHDVGIVHRDLKTPNIMRDSRGHVRLMDFGIAKQIGAEATMGATQMGMIVGTPEYMSPEQARGEKIDLRSDIYALGIVIYEIFTGNVPFRGETPIATIFKHLQEPPPLEGPQAAALPKPLLPVLARALAKSSADRFPTVADMVIALQEARMQAFPQARVSPTTPMPAVSIPSATPLPGTTVLPTPMPTKPPGPPGPPRPPGPPGPVGRGTGASARVEAPSATVVTPPPTVHTPTPAPAVDPEAAKRAARMKDLLARAEQLAASQKLGDAEQVLKEAVQVEPSHTLAQRLLASVSADLQRARAEEEKRAREGSERAARDKAEAEAKAKAKKDADLRAKQEADVRAKQEAEARAKAEAEQKRKADEARRKTEDEKRRADEEKRRADEAAAKKRADEEAWRKADEERKRRHAGAAPPPPPSTVIAPAAPATLRASAPSLPASVTPAPMPAPRPGPPVPLIAGGGAALLLALFAGGYLLTRSRPEPAPSPEVVVSPLPTAEPVGGLDVVPPPPAGLGSVVIDAAPWAEVVEITSADGQKQALPEKAYTPLVMSLPAGEYRVSLRSPGRGAKTVVVKVDAAGIAPVPRQVFESVDPQAYFQATGW
jgi:serine/threonine protein kinase